MTTITTTQLLIWLIDDVMSFVRANGTSDEFREVINLQMAFGAAADIDQQYTVVTRALQIRESARIARDAN